MRKSVIAALVAGLGVLGCQSPVARGYTPSAGSLALSKDDALLYAVDTDNAIVAVVDTRTQSKVAEVPVGTAPERIAVGPDDTLYVTNRGARSVSVIRRGQWAEAARVTVGVEPVGLAVAPDNSAVYVVSSTGLDSTDQGTLSAIDPRSLSVKWTLPVGAEPRGVTLTNDNRAVVTLYKQGEVVEVDLARQQVISHAGEIYSGVNAAKLGNGGPGTPPDTNFQLLSSFHPRSLSDVVVTPDGKRLFAPVVWSREDAIVTSGPPSGGGNGSYGSGGPCNSGGGVATPGLVTFNAATVAPIVDDLTTCGTPPGTPKDYPPTALSAPFASPTTPTGPVDLSAAAHLQSPVVAAVDSTGAWLFVVNRETNNVAVLPTNRRTGDDLSGGSAIRSLVNVGAGPNGIALTRDGKQAYVYNAFDHTVSVLVSQGTGSQAQVVETGRIRVADDVLPPDVVAGRKLFFSAADPRLSTSGTACETCHPDARDDGHTWVFSDGARRTLALAGRKLSQTAPYHWSGVFSTMNDIMVHTVLDRMGGTGLSDTESAQVAAYLEAVPAPDNPSRRDTPTDAQARGAAVFHSAGCDSCHSGDVLTNNGFADVGTLVVSGPHPDDASTVPNGFNVPSLLGVARTAPFLHDGRAATLEDLLKQGGTLHGNTSNLTMPELSDLVEYLKSL